MIIGLVRVVFLQSKNQNQGKVVQASNSASRRRSAGRHPKSASLYSGHVVGDIVCADFSGLLWIISIRSHINQTGNLYERLLLAIFYYWLRILAIWDSFPQLNPEQIC